jgi:hypothetical protein
MQRRQTRQGACLWHQQSEDVRGSAAGRRGATKKQQIIALYLSGITDGITDIEELAGMTSARPSYVATVLQNAGLFHALQPGGFEY